MFFLILLAFTTHVLFTFDIYIDFISRAMQDNMHTAAPQQGWAGKIPKKKKRIYIPIYVPILYLDYSKMNFSCFEWYKFILFFLVLWLKHNKCLLGLLLYCFIVIFFFFLLIRFLNYLGSATLALDRHLFRPFTSPTHILYQQPS